MHIASFVPQSLPKRTFGLRLLCDTAERGGEVHKRMRTRESTGRQENKGEELEEFRV